MADARTRSGLRASSAVTRERPRRRTSYAFKTPARGLSGRLFLVAATADHFGGQQAGTHLVFDLARDFLVLLQVGAHVVLALADAVALVGVPRARLLDDVVGARDVDDLTLPRDAQAVHDLELGLAEWRGNLVLHHLHAGEIAS